MTFDNVKYALALPYLPNDRLLLAAGLLKEEETSPKRYNFTGRYWHKNNIFLAKSIKHHLHKYDLTIHDYVDSVATLVVNFPHASLAENLVRAFGLNVEEYHVENSDNIIGAALGSLYGPHYWTINTDSQADMRESIGRHIALHYSGYHADVYTELDSRQQPSPNRETLSKFMCFFAYFYNFIENERPALVTFLNVPEKDAEYMKNLYQLFQSEMDWPRISRLVRSEVPMNEWAQYQDAPMAWLNELSLKE